MRPGAQTQAAGGAQREGMATHFLGELSRLSPECRLISKGVFRVRGGRGGCGEGSEGASLGPSQLQGHSLGSLHPVPKDIRHCPICMTTQGGGDRDERAPQPHAKTHTPQGRLGPCS